jgi:hypothetical protein
MAQVVMLGLIFIIGTHLMRYRPHRLFDYEGRISASGRIRLPKVLIASAQSASFSTASYKNALCDLLKKDI